MTDEMLRPGPNGDPLLPYNYSDIVTSTTPAPCPEYQFFQYFHTPLTHAFIGIGIFGGILNLYVMVVSCKLFRRIKDVVHLFIISMSFGDFMVSTFAIPLEMLFQLGILDNIHDQFLCKFSRYAAWTGLGCSAVSLTLLNIDKLMFFKWPLRYSSLATKKRACVAILTTWIVVNVLMITLWWKVSDSNLRIDGRCSVAYMLPGIYESACFFLVILPVASSGTLSAFLFKLTRDMRKNRIIADQDRPQNFRQHLRCLLFIFVTTAWTVVSLLPYRIWIIVRIHTIGLSTDTAAVSCELQKPLHLIGWLLVYLVMLSTSVNPIITLTIYSPYRSLTYSLMSHCAPTGNTMTTTDERSPRRETLLTTLPARDTSMMSGVAVELMPLANGSEASE